jgi:hypothetical protein
MFRFLVEFIFCERKAHDPGGILPRSDAQPDPGSIGLRCDRGAQDLGGIDLPPINPYSDTPLAPGKASEGLLAPVK